MSASRNAISSDARKRWGMSAWVSSTEQPQIESCGWLRSSSRQAWRSSPRGYRAPGRESTASAHSVSASCSARSPRSLSCLSGMRAELTPRSTFRRAPPLSSPANAGRSPGARAIAAV